jgi:potassium voltage-gated channel Eag-related subfamily H protein 5
VIDIFLKFNTAYYVDGLLETKRSKIMQHYIQGDFLQDLFVVIPFLISRFDVPYADFALLLRVTKLSGIFESVI